jgi:hypothetical protein
VCFTLMTCKIGRCSSDMLIFWGLRRKTVYSSMYQQRGDLMVVLQVTLQGKRIGSSCCHDNVPRAGVSAGLMLVIVRIIVRRAPNAVVSSIPSSMIVMLSSAFLHVLDDVDSATPFSHTARTRTPNNLKAVLPTNITILITIW